MHQKGAHGSPPAIPGSSRKRRVQAWRAPPWAWLPGHTQRTCCCHPASACCCWSGRHQAPLCSPPWHAPCGAERFPGVCFGNLLLQLPQAPCKWTGKLTETLFAVRRHHWDKYGECTTCCLAGNEPGQHVCDSKDSLCQRKHLCSRVCMSLPEANMVLMSG